MYKRAIKGRAEKYQWLYHEISYDWSPTGTANFMWSKENELHEQVNQQLLELNDQAMQRIIAVAMSKCTVKQARICQLLLDGYTQQEIAIIENTNQSSVSKCINGSQVFSKGEYSTKGKTYGGLMRKMSKLLVVDEELRQIIKNMHNIVETL